MRIAAVRYRLIVASSLAWVGAVTSNALSVQVVGMSLSGAGGRR